MSAPLGDFDPAAVIYGKFTTYRPSTGAPFTLGGTPALSVYKDNSTTQSTSGVTLTADFDSVTGLNHFAVDTSADGTFYAAGSFFDVVVTTGAVDSVSAVGSVVGSFTLRKTSPLKPATAGRTLVVDAAGLGDANAVKVGPTGSGTAQTARDLGASVLLSPGTGTGQIALSSGAVTVGTLASGVITDSSIAASALNDKGNWLQPTVAGRTLDVTATGATGIDLGNVENQDAALDLTNTSILNVADGVAVSFLDSVPLGQIWSHATRVLTAGTNIALTKGVGLLGLNDLSAAQVNTEVDIGLADVGLTTTVTGRIDVPTSTRMATYTQPTGFLATTFPSTVASPTNITAATGVVLSTAGADAVADTTLRRSMANVELSATGDALSKNSLYGQVQFVESSNAVDNPGFITIYRTDGTTVLGTIALATDPTAEPIVAVGVV